MSRTTRVPIQSLTSAIGWIDPGRRCTHWSCMHNWHGPPECPGFGLVGPCES